MTAVVQASAVRLAAVTALRAGRREQRSDQLAEETPVAFVVNGVSHAVMLATPADLDDFALGFLLTEGLIDRRSQCYGIEAEAVAGGIELRMEIAAACEQRLRENRRRMAGRSGCGLCGAETLAMVRRPLPALPVKVRLSAAAIVRSHAELPAGQAIQKLTGATHAAAWCALDGRVEMLREDIGRHNALDKLIGAMQRGGADPAQGFACITSRASFEMVQKAAGAGIAALVAVSAPTAMAVDLAASLGLLLVGFARGEDAVAYSFPERIALETARP